MVVFFLGGVTVLLSLRMPIGTFRAAGTGLFPFYLGILLMILSGIFLLKLFSKDRQTLFQEESVVEIPKSTKQMILFLGTMGLAALFFNPLGYPVTSFFMMIGLLRTLGVKRWTFNILLSFSSATVSYLLFVQWLKIPLPKGWIGL